MRCPEFKSNSNVKFILKIILLFIIIFGDRLVFVVDYIVLCIIYSFYRKKTIYIKL